MKLTAITELIQTILSDPANASKFTELLPVRDIPVMTCILPRELLEKDAKGIYVLPDYMGVQLDPKSGRRQVVAATTTKYVTVMLGVKFDDISEENQDITSWTEAKKYLNLKEEIDALLLTYDYFPHDKMKIVQFEPAIPEDEELRLRFLMVGTQIGFDSRC